MYPYQKATAVNKVNIPVSIISLQIQISTKTIVEGIFRYHCQGSSIFVLTVTEADEARDYVGYVAVNAGLVEKTDEWIGFLAW